MSWAHVTVMVTCAIVPRFSAVSIESREPTIQDDAEALPSTCRLELLANRLEHSTNLRAAAAFVIGEQLQNHLQFRPGHLRASETKQVVEVSLHAREDRTSLEHQPRIPQ